MTSQFDIAIVGGGIVGVATAFKLQAAFPDLAIALIEKESRLADHQTGKNSGVIHSGIYYKPGSQKARNCVEGRRELVSFVKEHNIRHDLCGKVIVATDPSELPHMEKIYQRGIENGVEGIEKIDATRIREIEPFCEGIAGLWVGSTGIVDFRAMTEKMGEIILSRQEKSRIFLSHEVIGVERSSEQTTLITPKARISARQVIYCGGLQADRLARKDKVSLDMAILGFRGDYYELSEKGREKVRNLIYPVPNPQFPFLGVHFTRMVDGTVECGPNAVFVFKREGYRKTDFDLTDTAEALSFTGTWKFFAKHWQFGLEEYRRAFSKKLFLHRLQRLIPSLQMDDLDAQRAGVRAMALSARGEMIDDFKIEYKDNSIHVLNAPSPAATACLAIGNDVRQMASSFFKLV